MTNNNRFMPAFEKGRFNGLVGEGESLRQKLAFRAEFAENIKSRLKTSMISVNPVILSIFSSCPSCASWLKNPFNQRNPRLINDLRSTKAYVRKNNLFMQNKAKFRKVKFNVNKVLKKNYEQMDTWSIRTKQSQTNPTCRGVASGEDGNKPNFCTIGSLYCLQLTLTFANLLRNFAYGYQ